MKTRKTTCNCCEVPEHQACDFQCDCCGSRSSRVASLPFQGYRCLDVDIPVGWKEVRMIESVSVGGTPPVEIKHICAACLEVSQVANLLKQS